MSQYYIHQACVLNHYTFDKKETKESNTKHYLFNKVALQYSRHDNPQFWIYTIGRLWLLNMYVETITYWLIRLVIFLEVELSVWNSVQSRIF